MFLFHRGSTRFPPLPTCGPEHFSLCWCFLTLSYQINIVLETIFRLEELFQKKSGGDNLKFEPPRIYKLHMLCPICYFVRFAINSKSDVRFASEANQTSDLLLTSKSDVRFAIQPREWKNLENGSKNVENAFKNDLRTSRMHFKLI